MKADARSCETRDSLVICSSYHGLWPDCPFITLCTLSLDALQGTAFTFSVMALRILASEAASSLGLRRAAPMLSGAQPQFLQIFSQNFASSKSVFDVLRCGLALDNFGTSPFLLLQSQRMWSIKIAMSGRRSRARQLLSAFPTSRRCDQKILKMLLDMHHMLPIKWCWDLC